MEIWFSEDYRKAFSGQLTPSSFLRFPVEKLEPLSTDGKKKFNCLIKVQVVNDQNTGGVITIIISLNRFLLRGIKCTCLQCTKYK